MSRKFEIVGIREQKPADVRRISIHAGVNLIPFVWLGILVSGCACCGLFGWKNPAYMDLSNCAVSPCREFWFGTDMMGRDIFSMIWYGGRASLTIGVLATVISTLIAVIAGGISGLAPRWLGVGIMRLTEILLSIPGLLLTLFVQAMIGNPTVLSLSVVIGATGWMSIAKVVDTQVRQLRECEYVQAAGSMGAGRLYILARHLMPNFFSSIMFMVVMNIRNAIVAESTLSFLGIGLPLEVISWGSMLSLSEQALLTGAWHMILIPGLFLVVTLLCITELGNNLQRRIS